MAHVELKNVCVDIPIFNSQGRSLKKTVMGIATGGKIGLTEKGVTVIRSLDNINLVLKPGDRLGIIGHNGAGKSTLLRVLGKVYYPSSGTSLIQGSIGSLIDISLGIDQEATGLENIFLRGALLGIPKKEIEEKLEYLRKNPQLIEEIGKTSRKFVEEFHDCKVVIKKYIEIFNKEKNEK